ncbi:MAG: NAD(P)/FAD-dependent oxidoreductase [Candidatus Binatia bacterium]
MHRIVTIGGGFGGLCAAQWLKNLPVQVTLIDRRNFHLFQPLLYQVATGWLSPANIASTLRAVLRYQKNAQVLLAEVTDIDAERRKVIFAGGELGYDTLIVATGSSHDYFGHDDWKEFAPGLKTIEDATEMRRRIFSAFESAEREHDPAKIRAWLTFIIVGGGPTGVELAGALADIAYKTLTHDFRSIDPADAQILLVEASDRILSPYPEDLSSKAQNFLNHLGVSVQTGTAVAAIRPGQVAVRRGKIYETIPCQTVLWAAGVRASPLGAALARRGVATLDRSGRVIVQDDFSLADHPEIFVIGDLANYTHRGGKPLPGIAPVAQQAGRYVAKVIGTRLTGKTLPRFEYRERGSMAIVGRATAIADLAGFHLAGFTAWIAWLFVHLMQLVEYQNRVLVLVQWGWFYFRRSRAARLITGDRFES